MTRHATAIRVAALLGDALPVAAARDRFPSFLQTWWSVKFHSCRTVFQPVLLAKSVLTNHQGFRAACGRGEATGIARPLNRTRNMSRHDAKPRTDDQAFASAALWVWILRTASTI